MKRICVAVAVIAAFGCNRNATKPGAGYGTTTAQQTQQSSTTPPTDVGNKMPAYTATLLDGKPFDLASEHCHVVFLNVWATWCGPCRFEIPELKKMHEKYGARGFEVVGVSVDEGGPQPVRDFVKENAINYPVALDAQGHIANLLQTTVLPTSLVIDRSGKIVWRSIGAIDESDQTLSSAIETALK